MEMRVRIIAELVLHADDYVQGVGMGGPGEACKVARMCGGATLTPEDHPSAAQVQTIFREDVMGIRHMSAFMGLWQFAALANVLHCKINSVYPMKGPFYSVANRAFLPRAQVVKELHFMWDSNRDDMLDEHWIANHVVPLMFMIDQNHEVEVEGENPTQDAGVPKEGEFCMVEWEGDNYVAQVRAIDEDLQMAYLSFMTSGKEGLFRWPLREEFSWESFSSVKYRVSLALNTEHSTQRVQYFHVFKN